MAITFLRTIPRLSTILRLSTKARHTDTRRIQEACLKSRLASKKAGVQTIIMSLWAVEDNATSLFMQTFYSEWFYGKTKHDAFKVAQETVRAEYPDACYWASFIMLD